MDRFNEILDKKRSCGILIHDSHFLLMGHSTGNTFFDIPKGLVKFGESTFDTMIRETYEEFNIDLTPFTNDIRYMGEFEYSRYKDLVLYELKVKYLDIRNNKVYIDNETFDLKCSSYFTINNERMLEIDGYDLIDVREINIKSCRSFHNTIKNNKLLME